MPSRTHAYNMAFLQFVYFGEHGNDQLPDDRVIITWWESLTKITQNALCEKWTKDQ